MILLTVDITTVKITNCSLTNKREIMKKNIYTLIITLVPVIMLMVPLAKPVLYVLFAIDVAAVIALGAITLIRKLRKKDLLFVPRFVLVWVLFNIALVVSLSRNILTTEAFENQNKISSLLFEKNTSTINIIISVVIFLCLTITGLIIGNTGKNRLKNQWESVKNEGNKEKIEFYGSLDGNFRFLNGAFIFIIFITAVIFLGGTLTGNLRYGKAMIDCIKENVMLAMGTSIVFQALNICCSFIVSNCFEWFEQLT